MVQPEGDSSAQLARIETAEAEIAALRSMVEQLVSFQQQVAGQGDLVPGDVDALPFRELAADGTLQAGLQISTPGQALMEVALFEEPEAGLAIRDAYVSEANPNTNYDGGSLVVGNDAVEGLKRALVAVYPDTYIEANFDIAGGDPPFPYHVVDMTSIPDYELQMGDHLEYELMWNEVEGEAESGMIFFSPANAGGETFAFTLDQNGIGNNFYADIEELRTRCLGKWYHRVFRVESEWIGQIMSKFLLWCSPENPGIFQGQVANIRITDGAGTIRHEIWSSHDSAPTYAVNSTSDPGNDHDFYNRIQPYCGFGLPPEIVLLRLAYNGTPNEQTLSIKQLGEGENVLPDEDSDFEGGTTGAWASAEFTLSAEEAVGYQGNYALKGVYSSVAANPRIKLDITALVEHGAAAYHNYNGLIRAKAAAGKRVGLRFWGNVNGYSPLVLVDPDGDWAELTANAVSFDGDSQIKLVVEAEAASWSLDDELLLDLAEVYTYFTWNEATVTWNKQPAVHDPSWDTVATKEVDTYAALRLDRWNAIQRVADIDPSLVSFAVMAAEEQEEGEVTIFSSETATTDDQKPQILYWSKPVRSKVLSATVSDTKLHGRAGGVYWFAYRYLDANNNPSAWSVPVRYELPAQGDEPQTVLFSVDPMDLSTLKSLTITALKPPDFSHYEIEVWAWDGANPPGTLDYTIITSQDRILLESPAVTELSNTRYVRVRVVTRSGVASEWAGGPGGPGWSTSAQIEIKPQQGSYRASIEVQSGSGEGHLVVPYLEPLSCWGNWYILEDDSPPRFNRILDERDLPDPVHAEIDGASHFSTAVTGQWVPILNVNGKDLQVVITPDRDCRIRVDLRAHTWHATANANFNAGILVNGVAYAWAGYSGTRPVDFPGNDGIWWEFGATAGTTYTIQGAVYNNTAGSQSVHKSSGLTHLMARVIQNT